MMTNCVKSFLECQCEDSAQFGALCILQMRSEMHDRIDLVDDLLSRNYGTSESCHPCLEDFRSFWICAFSIDESECVEMKSVSSIYNEFHEVMMIDHDA